MKINFSVKCLLLGGLLFSLCGCTEKSYQNDIADDIDLSDLLIPVESLPLGWSFSSSGPGIEQDRSFDSVGEAFNSDVYPESQGASQNIYRLRTIKLAKRDYQRSIGRFGFGTKPDEWTFESEYADESYFNCYKYSNSEFPVCFWGARYDRIIIEFRSWQVSGYMTLKDMEGMVIEIDTNAGKLIMKVK